MEFDLNEKYAIIRALERVAKSDEKLQNEEMNFLIKVTITFDLNSDDIYKSKEYSFETIKSIIKRMDQDKKDFLKQLLLDLSDSDNDVDRRELNTVMDIIL